MQTCFDDTMSLYRSTIHSQWVPGMQSASAEAYQLMCGPQRPVADQASPLERQPQPQLASFSPDIEDEETRHGDLTDDSGRASPASSEVRATVSIFRDPVSSDDVSLSVDSGVNIPQAETVFQKSPIYDGTQPYPFPSTSSFNPYGQHSNHPAYGFSMQPQSNFNTMGGNIPNYSPECEQPTDLSMPKGNQDKNHTDSEDENSDDEETPMQPHNQGQPGSSFRYPTYTHLSDVSNDSEDGAVGNKQPTGPYTNTPTASYANSRPGNQPENDFAPPNPLIAFLFGKDTLATNEGNNLRTLQQRAECLFTWMNRVLEPEVLEKLVKQWQIWLDENFPELKTGKVIIRELDDSNEPQPGTQQYENRNEGRNDNEERNVINPIEDDDENEVNNGQEDTQQPAEQQPPPGEQQSQHESITQPYIEQMQPEEPLAMYSLSEKGAESFTPTVELSPTPAQEFVLPTQLSEEDIRSATSTEEPVRAPSPESPMEISSPQPSISSPPEQNYTTEGPTEYQPVAVVLPAEPFSALSEEQSSSSQDHPMEQLCEDEQSVLVPAPEDPPPMQSESIPETSQSLVVFSSCQPPTHEAENEEHTGACERRSREPWDHKGLVRFVAGHAFTLPRYVWAERKEGQPRRSMRIAKKKQLKIYFLRERLPSKSASDKRHG